METKHKTLFKCEGLQGSLVSVLGLDEGYIVSFQHDPSQWFPGVPLGVNLEGLVQNQVHVLVETWTTN